MKTLSRSAVAFGLGIVLVGVGCGSEEGEDPNARCVGKCDSISKSFKDLYSKMDQIDLGDLVLKGAELATDEVNDQLSDIPYARIRLSATEVYGTKAKAARDISIHDIESLRAGLAQRYGDGAFVTYVNGLRSEYLAKNPGQLFAEAHFKLGVGGAKVWSYKADGLGDGGYGWVGFSGNAEVQTRVITPVSSEARAALDAPLEAIKRMRGYVMPRSASHVRKMVPGATLALRSHGTVGFNVGIGVPFYLATVATYATLHAVFSAGARATLTGDLDVQLIRDRGEKALVDVGVTGEAKQWMKVALETRWGVEGLPEARVAGFDLTRTAEKGLASQLNDRLKLEAAYSRDNRRIRHTISRFSFDLSRDDESVDQAMIQALRGDIRLAQALANREGSGVVQLLDFTRDSRSLSSYLGVSFLGMKFYREKADRESAVVVTSDGKSQSLLFDELERESGFFVTGRGYKRLRVASLISEDGKLVDADHNLRITLREHDAFVSRDQVLDHVDQVLSVFTGHKALQEQVALYTDQLERHMNTACGASGPNMGGFSEGQQEFEECMDTLADGRKATELRASAERAIEGLISHGIQGGFDNKHDSAATFVEKLGALKIAMQNYYENAHDDVGSNAALMVEYRLSAAALRGILARPDASAVFEQHLKDTLYSLYLNRGSAPKDRKRWVEEEFARNNETIARMVEVFKNGAKQYRQMVNLEQVTHDSREFGQTDVGDRGHLMVADKKGRVTLRTIAERKANIAAALFDALVEAASGVGEPDHQVVGYALLRGADPAQMELLVNFAVDKGRRRKAAKVSLYGRGKDAKLIDAGRFDLYSLLR